MAVLLTLLALLLALPAAGADWPMFRGDAALTGVAAAEDAAALAGDLAPVWSFEAEDGIESTAAIVGGTVYVGSLDGHLYALALADGTLRFKADLGAAVKASPTVDRGTVYLGDEAGVFHALDAATGETRWRFTTDGEIISSATLVGGDAEGAGRKVLFGSYDGFLYALDAADGSLAFKVETESYVHATPSVADGYTYIGGCDGFFRRISVTDGSESSALPVDGYVAASSALAGGRAYVPSFENEVLAIDLGGGGVLWRYRHPERSFPFYASPAIGEDVVVVGGRDKLVHALDPNSGEARWTFATPARVEASPVIAGDRVFAASKSGDLYALALADGKELWSFNAGAPITASPAVGGGRLVIGNLDGLVLAFAPKGKP